MVYFLTKQTHRTIVMCVFDWSLKVMKQFSYAIHQHSEKRIQISTVTLLLALSIFKSHRLNISKHQGVKLKNHKF